MKTRKRIIKTRKIIECEKQAKKEIGELFQHVYYDFFDYPDGPNT